VAETDVATRNLYFTSNLDRERILQQFKDVRQQSERLCAPLETEDYVVQSMEDASPTRWHLAHTTWFFETFVLSRTVSNYRSPHPQYAYLFNSYYVAAGDRYPRPQRGLITRPTVEDVYRYRSYVDRQMEEMIRGADDELFSSLLPVIEIGNHHEQQHQELILTDIKHALSFNPLFPLYRERKEMRSLDKVTMNWPGWEGGLVEIGHSGKGFCYDNELPRHKVFLQPFHLSSRLVTNGEYLRFMEDGGYERQTLWLSDGWNERQRRNWTAPLYWQKVDGEWHAFTLNGFRKIVDEEPVTHVSFYEADAYARWAGARLPREEEWEHAAADQPLEGNFVEQESFHPVPASSSSGPISQIFGDVWEWTASPYVGYPGYAPPIGVLGEYNGKFMANQMVLRGGSCATPLSHIRSTYLNFFYPTARWQFTGIRLARDSY